MAGRRPIPTAIKLVAGNPGKRAINKKEPQPRKEIPACPAHLPDVAKVAWGKLCVVLDRMGVLTAADAMALERAVGCYAELMQYQALVDRDGATYQTTSTVGETVIKGNPAVAMLADADRRFKGYLIEFGLTPAARSKVHGTGKQEGEEQDPMQEFFGS